MRGNTNTWRQLLAQRRDTLFIGREREQELFRLNFLYQTPTYLIFALHGPAGVGKSALLTRYRDIAEEHDAVTARIDRTQATAAPERTIIETMQTLARQYATARTPLTVFDDLYAEYQLYREVVAGDYNAPEGVFGILRNANEEGTPQADAWNTYLFDRFNYNAKIALIKDPVHTLTQAFVNDINAWATVRQMLFCFDDWDHIGSHLGPWLQNLLTQNDVRTAIWLAIAGEAPLDETWAPFHSVIADYDVRPFTEHETRAFLAVHHVTEPERVADIVTFSGGTPLLAGLLAGAGGGQSSDLALTAVDRYLKWQDFPWQRDAILQCAAARYLDADIVSALVADPNAEVVLDWLPQIPGTVQEDGHWRFHPEIRRRVLAFAQQQSSGMVQTAHTRLLAMFRNRVAAQDTVSADEDDDTTRCADWHEMIYHGLMIANEPTLQEGVAAFFAALPVEFARAGDVLRTWQAALGDQLGRNAVTRWGQLLQQVWDALEGREWETSFALCEAIAQRDDLDEPTWQVAEAFRQTLEARLRPPEPEPLPEPEPEIMLEPEPIEEIPPTLEPKSAPETLPITEISSEPEPAAAPETRPIAEMPPETEPEAAPEIWPIAEVPPEPELETAPQTTPTTEVEETTGPEFALPEAPIAAEPTTEAAAVVQPEDVLPVEDVTAETETPPIPLATQPTVPIVPTAVLPVDAEEIADAEKIADAKASTHAEEIAHAKERVGAEEVAPSGEGAPSPEDVVDVEAADYVQRADVYLGMGEYARAIEAYSTAIELDPEIENVYYNRGLAYAQQGQHSEALADFTQAIALDPEHIHAYYNRGLVYARQNDLVEAIADYEEACARAPEDAAIYNSRANAYYKIRDYQHAIADYDLAIRYAPTYADAYLNRGLTYATIEEYQHAIADYNQAIALNPESAVAYNYRGLAYARLHQHARALEDYDRALMVDPGYAVAHNNRGLCFVRLGNHDLALAEYQKAVDITPEYATAHYNAACAAALSNDAATACVWLEEAIRLAPRYQSMAQRDTDFDMIRGDTAFRALLAAETTGD